MVIRSPSFQLVQLSNIDLGNNATWNTTIPSSHISGQMMEGQTLYTMFNNSLKLIPKEVSTKVVYTRLRF